MDRREFITRSGAAAAVAAIGAGLMGCVPQGDSSGASHGLSRKLPGANPDPDNASGVDLSINMATIDEWLDRDDVDYIDVRMVSDPADFAAVGGDADLSSTIEGFRVVPCPYVLTLPPMPVNGAYAGPSLFAVSWSDDGSVLKADPRYAESEQALRDLFPQDKALFIMCGAGVYASAIIKLLAFKGWDESMLYNVGGNWYYRGNRGVPIIETAEDGSQTWATWRLDQSVIDFDRLAGL